MRYYFAIISFWCQNSTRLFFNSDCWSIEVFYKRLLWLFQLQWSVDFMCLIHACNEMLYNARSDRKKGRVGCQELGPHKSQICCILYPPNSDFANIDLGSMFCACFFESQNRSGEVSRCWKCLPTFVHPTPITGKIQLKNHGEMLLARNAGSAVFSVWIL